MSTDSLGVIDTMVTLPQPKTAPRYQMVPGAMGQYALRVLGLDA